MWSAPHTLGYRLALRALGISAIASGLLVTGALSLQAFWLSVALVSVTAVAPVVARGVGSGLLLALVLSSAVLAPGGQRAQFLSLVLALLACGAWTLEQLTRRCWLVHGSRATAAALAFIGVAVLSFVVGQYPWFPTAHAPMRAQLGGLSVFLASAGLFLASGHQLKSVAQLRALTWMFLGLGGLFVLRQAMPFVPAAALDRVTAPDTVGSLFWTWFVAIAFSQAAFNDELPPVGRTALALIGGLALYRGLAVAFSWVSGWLPPLVAVATIFAFRFPRTSVGLALLGLAPALALGAPALGALANGESYSIISRLDAFRAVLLVLERNPWLGYGPANYYHYTPLFPVLGWWVRFNSHNNYLDIVAQLGVVGLAVFLWFAAEMGALTWNERRRLPGGFARAYAVGAFAGLAASLVAGLLADWIVPFAYNIGVKGFRSSLLFWLFLGGALALARLHPRHPRLA